MGHSTQGLTPCGYIQQWNNVYECENLIDIEKHQIDGQCVPKVQLPV